jgi:hypothetical protein
MASSVAEPATLGRTAKRGVVAAVALAVFCVDVDFFALNLALPATARELHVTTTDLQWAIAVYQLTLASFLIPGGRLGDLLDSRDSSAQHIDLKGLVAVTLGIAAFTYAIDRGSTWGWLSASTLGLAAAGIALLAGFLVIERHVRSPLVDLKLFRNTCSRSAASRRGRRRVGGDLGHRRRRRRAVRGRRRHDPRGAHRPRQLRDGRDPDHDGRPRGARRARGGRAGVLRAAHPCRNRPRA